MTPSRIVTVVGMGIIGLVGLTAQVGCSIPAQSVALHTTDALVPNVARRMTQRDGRQAETQLSSPVTRSR
jgi:hypothetical protein